MNALAVDGLTKTYPSFTLDHMSFTLGRGRIMGLIGKNGAGKSTTIKSILHLVSPDSGHVEVLGMDMADQEAACKQAMGVVLGRLLPAQKALRHHRRYQPLLQELGQGCLRAVSAGI